MNECVEPPMGRREFLMRSAAAGALAGSAVPESLAASESKPKSPPTLAAAAPADSRLANRQLDSRKFSLSEYESIRPSLAFPGGTADEVLRWQQEGRAKLVELMGEFPERVPLEAEVLESRDMGDYTRETLVFQTRRNLTAYGYLLLPKDREGTIPAMVCVPGHGRGVDDIVGIETDGTQRAEKEGYAKDFAIQAVEHGYATLAIEPLGFGHRRDEAARSSGPGQNSCRPAAGAAMLFGETMVGWRVWDVIRAIDYLQTRPEVDGERVGVMGISGGGTVSLFAAAVDDRIGAAMVSGYFNTFRDSIVSLSHCLDNYVPGLLRYMEMYDVAGLIAPRALFVESGEEDHIFPIAAAREAFDRTRPMYRALGAEDRLAHEVFAGGHEFNGGRAWKFLNGVFSV